MNCFLQGHSLLEVCQVIQRILLLLEVQRPDNLGVELHAVELRADEDESPHENINYTSEVRDTLQNSVHLAAVCDNLVTEEEVGTPHDMLFLQSIGLAHVSAGIDCPDVNRSNPWLVDQVVDEGVIPGAEGHQLQAVIVGFNFVNPDEVVVVPIQIKIKHELRMKAAL